MRYFHIKRFLLGEPLSIQEGPQEPLPKWKALSTLSSDALSSVAYATDEILLALAAFSAAAVIWSIPIAVIITLLLIILTASYRQTISAYPGGGGAYTVVRENLGQSAGLVAGASLLIDYVLTVSVSVAAGVDNIASAFPILVGHEALLSVVAIGGITLLSLRSIRDSAAIYVFPAYFFVLSVVVLLGVGFWKVMTGAAVPAAPLIQDVYPVVPMVLILRAFASGCAALTGVETISNNVAAFEVPAQKNAKTTLLLMSAILGAFLCGITALAHAYGLMPSFQQTVISSLGEAVFGRSWAYYFIQVSVALVLFVAARTSYMGFPRLASVLAKDRFLPRQLTSLGDRLVFSNAVLGLGVTSAGLAYFFDGNTHRLIPLYAIGVFLSFTLSQAGMVAYHYREKKPGWIRSLSLNGIGAITTFVVLVDITLAKFFHGAWLVLITIPALVFFFTRIHRHYVSVGKELSTFDEKPPLVFKPVKHTVVIPVSGMHRGVIEALRYAMSISTDVRACYVEIDPTETERMKEVWSAWAPGIPFVVLKSPYRSVIRPLIKYIDDVEHVSGDDMVTVVVPEFVTSRWWHRVLHNQTALFIRTALTTRRRKVVTSVRYHLRGV